MLFRSLLVLALVAIVLFLRWNGSIGPKHSAHERIWGPARTVDSSRLSQFQRLAESECLAKLAADGFRFSERIHHNAAVSNEPYIEAKISGTPLTLWIYIDGGGVSGPNVDSRFSDWDAGSPEKLAAALAAAAADLARRHRDHAA